jgi:hypothetical protein
VAFLSIRSFLLSVHRVDIYVLGLKSELVFVGSWPDAAVLPVQSDLAFQNGTLVPLQRSCQTFQILGGSTVGWGFRRWVERRKVAWFS